MSRDRGIGFCLGFLEDLTFTRELVSSDTVSSSSFKVGDVFRRLMERVRIEVSDSTSSLIRFDGFGLEDRDVDGWSAFPASNKVTAL